MLGAIPTIVLFTITYVAYRVIVHKPLLRMLAERRARTQGAVEKAQQDMASAEAKTSEYERQLREARMEIRKAQEARRHKGIEERTAMAQQVRAEAEQRVEAERASLSQDVERAKAEIESHAESLAQEVVAAVMKTRQTVGAGQR